MPLIEYIALGLHTTHLPLVAKAREAFYAYALEDDPAVAEAYFNRLAMGSPAMVAEMGEVDIVEFKRAILGTVRVIKMLNISTRPFPFCRALPFLDFVGNSNIVREAQETMFDAIVEEFFAPTTEMDEESAAVFRNRIGRMREMMLERIEP